VIRRLLLALQQAGLVETRKGAGHGSGLKRSAVEIRLSEVYRAVENEETFAYPRRKPSTACPVGHCIQKALGRVFASAERAMADELGKTSLADILAMVKGCVEG